MSNETNNSSCAVVAATPAPATGPLSRPAPSPSTLNAATEQNSEQPSTIHSGIPPGSHDRRPQNNGWNDKNNRNKRRRRGKLQQAPLSKVLPPGCSVCKIIKDDDPPKYKCPKCRALYCSVACCRQHKTVCPGKEGECSSAIKSTQTTKTAAMSTPASTQKHTPNNTKTADIDGCDPDTDDNSDDDDDSDLEDGWKITDDMKVALRNSTWLRTELQDSGLRDMIASVVRSEKKYKSFHRKKVLGSGNYRNNNKNKKKFQQKPIHPHQELEAKRADNKNFDVFIDKTLVLADVLERQQEIPMDLENGESGFAPSGGPPSNRNEEELEEWLRLKWEPGMAQPVLSLRPRKKVIPKFEPVDFSSSSDDEGDNYDEPLKPKENADQNISGDSLVGPPK